MFVVIPSEDPRCFRTEAPMISTEINAFCPIAKFEKRHMLLLNGRAIFHEKREAKGDQEFRQRDSREVRATGSATVELQSSNSRRTEGEGREGRPQGRLERNKSEGKRL